MHGAAARNRRLEVDAEPMLSRRLRQDRPRGQAIGGASVSKWAGYLLLFGLVFLAAEVSSYLFLRSCHYAITNRLYWPPFVKRHDFETYLQERDPLLGWPTKIFLAQHADIYGARPSPANLQLADQHVCISVYGDSFTFSDEVSDAEAWPNLLAEELRCEVRNYGVSGYGVDQAVLRFEKIVPTPQNSRSWVYFQMI
jgi:hypothetical protein